MAEDIIIHVRVSEISNKELYNELKQNKSKRAKRLTELANIGLQFSGKSTNAVISEMQQDILLLKSNVLALQSQISSGVAISPAPILQPVIHPVGHPITPPVPQPVSMPKEEPVVLTTPPTSEVPKDTINISEDTDAPISSDAMDSLRSLLNG